MAKGRMLVGICSVVIVVMFTVMYVLVSNIEPPKLDTSGPTKPTTKTTTTKTEATTTKAPDPSDTRRNSDGMFFDDSGLLPIVDTAQYGLEKIDSDVIDFYRSTKKPLNYQNKDRKVIPPLWPRITQEIIVNPTMHKVMPPIWPTTSVIIDTAVSNNVKMLYPKNNNRRTDMQLETHKSIVKPMKRRSVNNYILDEDTESVVLKILDNNGQSKIEIKLWSDQLSYKMKEKAKNLENLAIDPRYSITSDNYFEHKDNGSVKNTIVTIMANDSIIVEESGGSNITELFKPVVINTLRDQINKSNNITDDLRLLPAENTLDYDKSGHLLLNITESLGDMVNNSSIDSLRNDSRMGIMKNTTYLNTMKNNNSDHDTFASHQTNNTELDKIVFEEVVNNPAGITNANSRDNDKISITDIYPTNYTDLFIENDSDMVY